MVVSVGVDVVLEKEVEGVVVGEDEVEVARLEVGGEFDVFGVRSVFP